MKDNKRDVLTFIFLMLFLINYVVLIVDFYLGKITYEQSSMVQLMVFGFLITWRES